MLLRVKSTGRKKYLKFKIHEYMYKHAEHALTASESGFKKILNNSNYLMRW